MAKTREDLIKTLMGCGLDRKSAKHFIQSFVDAVESELVSNGTVKVPRLGVIKLVSKPSRPIMDHFRTKDIVMSAAVRRPKIMFSRCFSQTAKELR